VIDLYDYPPGLKYPPSFPEESRGKVEAEEIRAGQEFENARRTARKLWRHELPLREHFRNFCLRILTVFAAQARDRRLWQADKFDAYSMEFLQRLTYRHKYKRWDSEGQDLVGELYDYAGDWQRYLEVSDLWQRYQDIRLDVAEPQEPIAPHVPPAAPTAPSPAAAPEAVVPAPHEAGADPPAVLPAASVPADPAEPSISATVPAGAAPAAEPSLGAEADFKTKIAIMKASRQKIMDEYKAQCARLHIKANYDIMGPNISKDWKSAATIEKWIGCGYLGKSAKLDEYDQVIDRKIRTYLTREIDRLKEIQ
jgi:hypothetical protein